MKEIIFVTILFLVSFQSFCQSWSYAELAANYSDVSDVRGSAVDASGNIYIAGRFSNCYHCSGPVGLFINKYDTNGNLIWSDTLHTIWGKITALFITPENKICVVGSSSNGPTNFFGFPLNGSYPSATGFVSEFDMTGNCLSANTIVFSPYAVKLNNDSTLSIAGECHVTFSNLAFTSLTGYFVGNFQDFTIANWINAAPPPASWTFDPIIANDSSNNIYFTELYGHNVIKYGPSGDSTICGTNYPAMHCENNNLFHASSYHLEKYSPTGSLLWTKSFLPWVVPNNITSYNGNLLIFL